MSAWTCHSSDGKADRKIVPPRSRIPYWKGPGADSEEKHEPASDIDTAMVDSLKALDPERPIREADMCIALDDVRFGPISDIAASLTDQCDGPRLRLHSTPNPVRVRQVRAACHF